MFVSKAKSDKDPVSKMEKKVYARLEVDFNSRRRDRYIQWLVFDELGNGSKQFVLGIGSKRAGLDNGSKRARVGNGLGRVMGQNRLVE